MSRIHVVVLIDVRDGKRYCTAPYFGCVKRVRDLACSWIALPDVWSVEKLMWTSRRN